MPFSRRDFLKLAGTAAIRPRCLQSLAMADSTGVLCQKLATDPLRPQYHLLPARNWMNDPNGPIYFQGRYHMFYQYNPQGAVWGNMNWAHATSSDMVHWQHEPIALSPTPGGPDCDGVFSGSAVVDKGRPTVIYTGVAPPTPNAPATLRDGVHTWRETQCLAFAQDDDLRIWKKLPDPVIAAPPAGLKVIGFRDPCLWREGNQWMLILGSGVRGRGGMILLYSSHNLRHWTFLHPLIEGSPGKTQSINPVDNGEMWECPDFFPFGNKHVLLLATMGKVHWKVGTYANQHFTAEKEGVVDWGAYYAAKSMLDAHGNRILWGWIPETRPDTDLIAAGWAGVMSLPRVLSLNKQNELETTVAPVARQLGASHEGASLEMYELEAAGQEARRRKEVFEAFRIHDLAAELEIFLMPKSEGFAFRMQSESSGDFANISCVIAPGRRQLRVNNTTASLAQGCGTSVRLNIFVDGSVLEIFANGTAVTERVYQIPSGPLRLILDGDAGLISFQGWQIRPISKNRLTGSFCR